MARDGATVTVAQLVATGKGRKEAVREFSLFLPLAALQERNAASGKKRGICCFSWSPLADSIIALYITGTPAASYPSAGWEKSKKLTCSSHLEEYSLLNYEGYQTKSFGRRKDVYAKHCSGGRGFHRRIASAPLG